MLNTTLLAFISTKNQFSTDVALFNTSFVSLLLLLLLLASLVLTFHSKGTTVHKVLGLLLVSIFVVFLWILQTQFLFIYVVYIMAFISAVLMLFLSVVLMLPISTLTSKNISSTSKVSNIVVLFQFSQVTGLSTLPIEVVLLGSFVVIYFIYQLLTKLRFKNNGAYLEWPESFEGLEVTFSYKLLNALYQRYRANTNYFAQNSENISSSFKSKIYKALLIATTILVKEINFIYLQTRVFFFILFQLLLKTIIIPVNVLKVVFDVVLQTYLFSSVFLSLAVSFISKQLVLSISAAELDIEIVQGIGQLKTLLYGDFSLFLIFSTIVLLVALLGAAVMTRSKR